jgi:hypothetical protein
MNALQKKIANAKNYATAFFELISIIHEAKRLIFTILNLKSYKYYNELIL